MQYSICVSHSPTRYGISEGSTPSPSIAGMLPVNNAKGTITMARPTSDNVTTVKELEGWVSTEYAMEYIGTSLGSIINIVYSQKVIAVRISGALLIKKESLVNYKNTLAIRNEKREIDAVEKRIDAQVKAEVKKQKNVIEARIRAEILAATKA